MRLSESRVLRNVFGPECNPKAFTAGDCIVESCMVSVAEVTIARRINVGGGGLLAGTGRGDVHAGFCGENWWKKAIWMK